jgi:hypothetical protein
MTILTIHTGEGMTKAMYENVRREVMWEGKPPPGILFHAASFDDSESQCIPSKNANISNPQNRCFTRTWQLQSQLII